MNIKNEELKKKTLPVKNVKIKPDVMSKRFFFLRNFISGKFNELGLCV